MRSSVKVLGRIRSFLLATFAFCVILPAVARAQEVRTEMSPKEMTRLLTSLGLEVQPVKSGNDKSSAMKFELGGYGVVLILANKNTDAQLYTGFRDSKATIEKVNQWNRENRFARAYIDNEGDPVLEADIDFTGGVTDENIKAWVKLFRDQLNSYAKAM